MNHDTHHIEVITTAAQEEINEQFVVCCRCGDWEQARHLLTGSGLAIHADISSHCDSALLHAAEMDDWYMVKYFLSSPKLKKHADIHAADDFVFRHACHQGNMEMVKYLLTSPELSQHADIHALDDRALTLACSEGFTEIVKYLLASTELTEHSHSDAYNDCLREAMDHHHTDIVHFFLYDMKIEITPGLYAWDDQKRKNLLDMCAKRDLFFKMSDALNSLMHQACNPKEVHSKI